MSVLATVGSYVSSLLHQVVFGFPSPSNATLSGAAADNGTFLGYDGENGVDLFAEMSSARKEIVDQMEPGEARALVAGIGPPSFFGSGYGVVLVVMALLMNRIHAVLHRPRIPAQPLPHPPTNSIYWKARRKFVSILTSPSAPRYLRVPGIICLLRAWSLFTILTLQTAQIWPSPETLESSTLASVLGPASRWAGGMQMKTVCWQVFVSVCAGLVCSGLANGLDRIRDIGNGFNLFGYSFLLHLYSSPLTHNHPPPSANFGRPDLATLIQLWLSLTELTWLQITEFSESTRGQQLIPTTVVGTLGLVHFVYVLMFAPRFFPSFTFLTHLLALFLSAIIVTTMACRALSFLFTYGYIPSPVLASLIPKSESLPSMYDDFGVTLLKLGVACMETTQWSGLKNELVGVETKAGPYVHLSAVGSELSKRGSAGTDAVKAKGGFGTEVTDIGVAKREEPNAETEHGRLHKRLLVSILLNLLGLALWALFKIPGGKRAYDAVLRLYDRRWWYGPRQWRFWRRAAWTAPPDLTRARRLVEGQRRAAEGFYRAARTPNDADALARARNVVVGVELNLRNHHARPRSRLATPDVFELDDQEDLDVPYHLYLRGEVEMDDDEGDADEWVPGEGDDGSETEMEDEGDSAMPWTASAGAGAAAVGEEGEEDLLLAHATSASPLTRRGYAALRSPSNQSMGQSTPTGAASLRSGLRHRSHRSPTPQPHSHSTAMTHPSSNAYASGSSNTLAHSTEPTLQIVAMQRRIAALEQDKGRDEWDDDRRKCCVVCTVEPRDTILWPCRCLALCNECRENLAERLSAKDHMCPCCRKKVEGFSRIYIP